jgi:N-acetylmuramoyl-L-alanine amidase
LIEKDFAMAFRWTGTAVTRHGRPMLGLMMLLAGTLVGGPALAATITDIAVSGSRIVIRFDAPVADATSRLLTDDHSIALDLDGVTPGVAAAAAGPVSAVRQRLSNGGTRVTFDLSEPAVIADGGFDADGRELTLSLQAVDEAGFSEASAAGPLSFIPFLGSLGQREGYRLEVPIPPAARALPLPRVQGDDSRPLVVIDAGHGGVDPGALNTESGLREKDLTLKIAKAIRDKLLESGRVRVALTRDDDRYLVLRERFGIARRLKASLFISIHCDSAGSPDATGASAYTLSEVASDKEAARLAARENKADVISGVNLGDAGADVSSILIDLTQRETMNNSADFARVLGREAKPFLPMKANFHRMASLMVLKAPDMPSILLETGYISNAQDAAFLDSRDGRNRIAESVEKAVEIHFARRLASR